jgi:Uncharacterized protein conserved in bacteria (DUF2188)
MGFDQMGDITFTVSPGKSGNWDVTETGFDKPLASFDSERDVCDYANGIAKTKKGSRFIVERR